MNRIFQRISIVVKESKLTKTDFAKRISVSQSHVSRLCNGETQPSERTIADICREFDINEDWLRYGRGRMKKAATRAEEVTTLVNSALNGNSDFKKAVIQAICNRTGKELEALDALLRDIYNNLPETKNAQADSQPGHKIIKIAGRDGSMEERTLTGEELEDYKRSIHQLPDAGDDI